MIQIIWLIFTVMFFILSILHFHISTKNIKNPESLPIKVKSINGASLGIAEFVNYFKVYIKDVNKSNKITNIIQGFGYLLASATSAYSYYLSLIIK
jgi:hypothetical protein